MILVKKLARLLLLAILSASHSGLYADELLVNFGGGNQPDASQTNKTFGVDYSFYRFVRSQRQHILLGISLTHMTTDAEQNTEVNAISIYPQLNLYPRAQSWGQPFFFVRALAPSYMSSNELGSRKQDHHFSFQAQVGFGAYLKYHEEADLLLSISYKHFSNANIFDDNDGFDFPVVISLGTRF